MSDKLTAITDHAKRIGRPDWQQTTHVTNPSGEPWTVASNGFVLACIKGGDLAAKDNYGDLVWEAATREVPGPRHTVAVWSIEGWASVERFDPCPKCKGARKLSHKCNECELSHPFDCPQCKALGSVPIEVVGKIDGVGVDLAMLRLALGTIPDGIEVIGLAIDPGQGGYPETVQMSAPGWIAAVAGNRGDANVSDFQIVEVEL